MPTEIASALELYAVDLINGARAEAGLHPVHAEVHLNNAAQSHSDWMAKNQLMSHAGENNSTPTDRIHDSEFPLQGGTWKLTENVAYRSYDGSVDEEDIGQIHSNFMDSPTHKENILDPDVCYVGLGLSVGTMEQDGAEWNVAFVTQNFAYSSQPVTVQENIAGQTTLTTFVDGEPIPGTSKQIPASEEGTDRDEHDADEDGVPDEDSNLADPYGASGGTCFVATAAYGDGQHPDVVTLRQFRDNVLVRHQAGRAFIRFYWLIGPKLAKVVHANHVTGRIVRWILQPCVSAARRRLCYRDR